jgi:hypothetical protein
MEKWVLVWGRHPYFPRPHSAILAQIVEKLLATSLAQIDRLFNRLLKNSF